MTWMTAPPMPEAEWDAANPFLRLQLLPSPPFWPGSRWGGSHPLPDADDWRRTPWRFLSAGLLDLAARAVPEEIAPPPVPEYMRAAAARLEATRPGRRHPWDEGAAWSGAARRGAGGGRAGTAADDPRCDAVHALMDYRDTDHPDGSLRDSVWWWGQAVGIESPYPWECPPFDPDWPVSARAFFTGVGLALGERVGYPWRPPVRAEWRTRDVVALAEAAWDARDWGRLPILADALEDAGCDHPGILTHLRAWGHGHGVGCWALADVLLPPPA